MSVQISALGAEEPYYKPHETDLVLPPMEFPTEVVTHSTEFLKQEAAVAPQQRIVGTVTYSPIPAAPSVRPAVPEYAPHATDLMLPSSERCGWFCRNRTAVLIGVGVVAIGGLATYMMLKPARGFKPAMAGLHGRRRRRHRR